MNTTLRALISTAFAAASLCALTAAHAGIQINGMKSNGFVVNGMQLNGFVMNGFVMNGMKQNGSSMDGQDAGLPAVDAIVLRDGRTLNLR